MYAAPGYHPRTQGKMGRWHQILNNRILLDSYYLPGDFELQIGAFVFGHDPLLQRWRGSSFLLRSWHGR
jgi:hypothetical protein